MDYKMLPSNALTGWRKMWWRLKPQSCSRKSSVYEWPIVSYFCYLFVFICKYSWVPQKHSSMWVDFAYNTTIITLFKSILNSLCPCFSMRQAMMCQWWVLWWKLTVLSWVSTVLSGYLMMNSLCWQCGADARVGVVLNISSSTGWNGRLYNVEKGEIWFTFNTGH